jgi:hypothetical protein
LVLKRTFLEAPVVNGQAEHLLDYDDTHMAALCYTRARRFLPRCFQWRSEPL